MPKLLVVDDEPVICQSIDWVFSPRGVSVVTAGSVADGWERFTAERPDVVLLDLQLPDGSGLDLFDRIRAADARRPVIFLTAHGTTGTAIEAMKRGAFDYLGKPFDLDPMTALLERAFAAAKLSRGPEAAIDTTTDTLIGRSAEMRDLSKQIGRVAPLDVTVLLLGESGTGKELVARAILQHSRRADRPFLAINCAAIPEGLVESELFGHEAGAFTGATRPQKGRFEQADGGTVFLDEIGDMPAAVQAKMLRFLQDQVFEHVGGRESIRTNVRVIAATNHDLEALIKAGRFRADLYYRLKDLTIRLPALRERTDDIPELADYFLRRFTRDIGRDIAGFDPAVLDVFRTYSWPGNVRELRGVVREAALRTTGPMILPEFLPPGLGQHVPPEPPRGGFDIIQRIDMLLAARQNDLYASVVRAVERELIVRVLRHVSGHQGHACERLGIDRKTLRNKLRELDISVDKVVTTDASGRNSHALGETPNGS